MNPFDADFLQFFIDLAPNNHKDWFDKHRNRYKKKVKEPMERFVTHMIDKAAAEDPGLAGINPKNCIFRINRDIRFSKDKTPYKLNTSAVISPLGRKDHRYPGLYFELGPERLAIAGGAYAIDKEALEQLRNHMMKHPKAWTKAIEDEGFLRFFDGVHGDENKRLPPVFAEAAKEQPLIFKKQLYYWAEQDADAILSPNLDQILLDHFRAARPVRELLKAAYEL